MPDTGDNKKTIGDLRNVSRNRRQASILLSEVARHRCAQAAETLSQGTDLIEKSKRIADKSKQLRTRKIA